MKKLLSISSVISIISSSLGSVISCSGLNDLDSVIKIREVDFNKKNLPYLKRLQKQNSDSISKFQNRMNDDISEEYGWYYKNLPTAYSGDKKILNQLDVDVKQKTPNILKSNIENKICEGQEDFGYGYPRCSQLHELNRIEIANFEHLKSIGYTIYANISDWNNEDTSKSEIVITNLDKSKEYINKNKENKVYFALTDAYDTGCIYFKSSDLITKDNISSAKGQTIDLIAVDKNNGDHYLTGDWDGGIPINVSTSLDYYEYNNSYLANFDFVQYRLNDWLKYEYSDSNNLYCYIGTQLINFYLSIGIGYIDYLSSNSYQKDKPSNYPIYLINGLQDVVNGNLSGDNGYEAAELYFLYKYGVFQNLWTENTHYAGDISMDANQNMPIKNQLSVNDNLVNTKYNKFNICELDYSPYISLNNQLLDFTKDVWNTLVKYEDKINTDWSKPDGK
ncbi:hypothetical protein [Spiroplasma endosymbiont of Aspidapion aeneum]|uniref:hypothetical protein n=1 Tax=Spiroplasma endosymbiont of Aspidapion aeneum TaxID=3066276 RepID=UPI00313F27E4